MTAPLAPPKVPAWRRSFALRTALLAAAAMLAVSVLGSAWGWLNAERALRHGVIYRKLSGGTDSGAGSRFVERMLSVVATCRQQDINVLDYLTRCYRARLDSLPAPSLLPATSTAQAG